MSTGRQQPTEQYESYGASPYAQAAPHAATGATGTESASGRGLGAGGGGASHQMQYGREQAMQGVQQAATTAQQKAQELSHRASEMGQQAVAGLKETMRHPSKATPYLLPVLAVLLICGASIVPLSLMAGKSAKDKIASAYGYGGPSERYGSRYGMEEPSSFLSDKWQQAKESLMGHGRGYEHEYADDRSFMDKVLGRRSTVDEMKYKGQRMREEMEPHHGLGEWMRSAKDKVLGGKETTEECAAGGSEFILQAIDSLSDKLHQMRRQYVGRTREEKPSGWMRSSWENIMEGMDKLRLNMMRDRY